jgi:TRAP-type mannitol/chloroaromatic compound transport system substrate-binding protein
MAEQPTDSRRAFLTGGLVGAAGGVVAASAAGVLSRPGASAGDAPSDGKGRRRVMWRLASGFPRTLDGIYGVAELLSARVAAMTGGAFQIRCHQAGELVPAPQVLDAVQQGSAELGQTAGYYYTGKNPALAFDTCIPFGLTARQQDAWLAQAGGQQLLREVYADFGVRNYSCGNTGAQMGGWFRGTIATAADLKGLRMRIPGLGGKVMDAMGVSVQNLAPGDIYPALERGAIDATEWVGPYDDEKLGFYEIAKNYYYPGWWEPGPSLSFLVSQTAFDALPRDYQEILEAAIAQAAQTMMQRYDRENPRALKRLLAAGVKLQRFSDDILGEAREASRALVDDQAAKDPVYRKIRDHWRAFAAESTAWLGSNELSYAAFAWA